jgi:hypothetical protein
MILMLFSEAWGKKSRATVSLITSYLTS